MRIPRPLPLLALALSAGFGQTPTLQAPRPAFAPPTEFGELQLLTSLRNGQGEWVQRYRQTYQGVPVYGTALVLRRGVATQVTARRMEAEIRLPGAVPRLGAAEAIRAAHEDLPAATEYLKAPSAERIVFPTRLAGTAEPRLDAATGRIDTDPLRSVAVGPLLARHVWAWHVVRQVASPKGHTTTLHAIVDGDSGRLLRKWAEGQDRDLIASGALLPPAQDYVAQTARRGLPLRVRSQAPALSRTLRPTLAPSYTPAVGTAITQFSGTVSIPTSADAANGGYALLDTQRGAGGGAWTAARGLTPGNRIVSDQAYDYVVGPDGNTVTTYYYDYTQENGTFYDWSSGSDFVTGSLDNTWGNGLDAAKSGWSYPCAFSDDAKTSAGEAMFAVSTTYDLLKNVLHRSGLDGLDSSIIVQANMSYAMAGKAAWVPDMGMFQVGMGDPAAWGSTSGSVPVHNGAELTTLAREFGVALHQSAAPVSSDPALETFHLQRATGALVSQLAEAYAQRGPSDPADAVPAATVDWMFGKTRADGRPWFWMDKPSRDGISPDAWFDGIWMLGQMYVDGFSFGDGPMNRAWFFMAQGASSDPASDAYSSFLPQGMTGLGLDKVGRIAYKALTERYTEATDYAGAREACLAAATDIHGAASPEVAAVANAFAAVNVGAAAGAPDPVRVTFPTHLLADGTPDAPMFQMQHYQVVPTGEWVKLKVQVANATNQGLTWKATGVPGIQTTDGGSAPIQGSFRADGAYMAPSKGMGKWGVQAWSVQDPKQFAQGVVWAFDLDGDGDGAVDALDFADFAMLCYLPYYLKDAINPNALFGQHTVISDPEIQLVTQAFHNAFLP